MMYRKCERCGANLDWGEKCDCGQQEGYGTYSDGERTEKKGMIALAGQKQGQEEKVTTYRFGDDERELTAGEKEAYAMAGSIAEKIHRAGLAAAAAQFSRMTYKEFKRAYKLPEWVKPEEYYFFSKSFYQAYCWGYEEGEKMKEHQFNTGKEQKE